MTQLSLYSQHDKNFARGNISHLDKHTFRAQQNR